jgi:hypothetical protein
MGVYPEGSFFLAAIEVALYSGRPGAPMGTITQAQ